VRWFVGEGEGGEEQQQRGAARKGRRAAEAREGVEFYSNGDRY